MSSKKMVRTVGHESIIWKVLTHESPRHCPECGHAHRLQYIGFARNYTGISEAKMYMCDDCGTWIDCIWPKQIAKPQANEQLDPSTRMLTSEEAEAAAV